MRKFQTQQKKVEKMLNRNSSREMAKTSDTRINTNFVSYTIFVLLLIRFAIVLFGGRAAVAVAIANVL